ncbi:cupin domain-containing protein [Flavobacterium sp. DG1-102-2]|uniref:cupin domain-containing protein n=1 Tax=Flavobacterium sp. DG1-102-2 TaxID=3081663 RepID=UPI002949D233|nr:cupin domain-containing protein [Flavobacterium sp. DG1-102-2]MDV6168097.1 cupin domain-containing protein [Flavobacterium sp. DG1-102-2]
MMSNAKTYYNPLNGEYTKILASSADTGGEYSLLEVYLMPGGGNPPHYHTRFTEEFFAVEGKLGLLYEKDTVYLEPGQNRLVPIGVEHRFFNDGTEPIVFRIMLRSGQPGFENFIKGLFGLVNDGRTTKSMIPKNPLYGAALLYWGDTHLKNLYFYIFSPLASLAYRLAKISGSEKKLLKTYCGD